MNDSDLAIVFIVFILFAFVLNPYIYIAGMTLRSRKLLANIFCCGHYYGCFWFRLFGVGVSVSNQEKNPPLFSERYGYRKFLYVGNYKIGYLKRVKRVKL